MNKNTKHFTEEDQKAAKRASYKKWYEKNGKTYRKKWEEANPGKHYTYAKKWAKAHPEKIQVYNKKHALTKDEERKRTKRRRSTVPGFLVHACACAKYMAKKRKLSWEIDAVYLYELYIKTPYCSVTHLPFDTTNKRTTISIDRIDSCGGYTRGNVRLVWWHINAALQQYGLEAFYEIAEAALAVRDAACQQQNTKPNTAVATPQEPSCDSIEPATSIPHSICTSSYVAPIRGLTFQPT